VSNCREPAVAGMFYDADPAELSGSIDALYLGRFGPGRLPVPAPRAIHSILGLVVPHAGFRFSGYAAASAYLALAEDGVPQTAVLIGPNHRGIGSTAAIVTDGTWRTPLGDVAIDTDLAEAVLAASSFLRSDASAHRQEHSLEVHLPFIQRISENRMKIVPITVSALHPDDARRAASDLGTALASAVRGRDAVLVASTDLSHYEPKHFAQEQDRLAIDRIERLDAAGLLDTVDRHEISMCGAVPTAAVVESARALGADRGELLSYYTSGDILGDPSQVVGYASLKLVRGA
jgi:MEMO1 family protein